MNIQQSPKALDISPRDELLMLAGYTYIEASKIISILDGIQSAGLCTPLESEKVLFGLSEGYHPYVIPIMENMIRNVKSDIRYGFDVKVFE